MLLRGACLVGCGTCWSSGLWPAQGPGSHLQGQGISNHQDLCQQQERAYWLCWCVCFLYSFLLPSTLPTYHSLLGMHVLYKGNSTVLDFRVFYRWVLIRGQVQYLLATAKTIANARSLHATISWTFSLWCNVSFWSLHPPLHTHTHNTLVSWKFFIHTPSHSPSLLSFHPPLPPLCLKMSACSYHRSKNSWGHRWSCTEGSQICCHG